MATNLWGPNIAIKNGQFVDVFLRDREFARICPLVKLKHIWKYPEYPHFLKRKYIFNPGPGSSQLCVTLQCKHFVYNPED